MAVKDWSTTEGSNTGILSGITLDGSVMLVPQVDNAFRQIAAQIAAQLGKVGFKGADVSSAATTNLANATGWYVDITGTTTITALGTVDAGQVFILRFAGALTFTHNASSLILPGAANITTAAGDVAFMVSLGSGNWRCVMYQRADGTPVGGVSYPLLAPLGSATAPSYSFTGDANTGIYASAADSISFTTGGTARVTVSNTAFNINVPINSSSSFSGTTGTFSGDVTANASFIGAGGVILATTGADTVFIRPNGEASSTGQMTVASTGNMLVNGNITSVADGFHTNNKTASNPATVGASMTTSGQINATVAGDVQQILNRTGSDGSALHVRRDNTTVGSITTSAGTTAYNTTSDYRLKDNIRDLEGSGAFIDALRPRSFEMKSTGKTMAGFIAHEFAEVSPISVTGEKDGEEYQAMQASTAEVMANVIKELQALRVRIAALET